MPRRLAKLAACAVLAVVACAAETREEIAATTQAIVGGEPAGENAWLNVGWLEAGCTATLVHERVIVFAAHCGVDHERVFFGRAFDIDLDLDAGTASLPMPERYESFALSRCERHPEAAIGTGFDVAFCELAQAVPNRAAVPLIAGCEPEQLKAGAEVTLVGFGFDMLEPKGQAGIKRVAEARVVGLSREAYIGDDDAGTCPGDSGGPAFMRVGSDAGTSSWRLAAVLSSGAVGECGVGRYTQVVEVNDWLEAASGHDLTPYCDGPSEAPACTASDVGASSTATHALFLPLVCLLMRLRHRRHGGEHDEARDVRSGVAGRRRLSERRERGGRRAVHRGVYGGRAHRARRRGVARWRV